MCSIVKNQGSFLKFYGFKNLNFFSLFLSLQFQCKWMQLLFWKMCQFLYGIEYPNIWLKKKLFMLKIIIQIIDNIICLHMIVRPS